MKLHLEKPAGLNMFTAYGEGYVAVNLEKHEKNLILMPDAVILDWTTSTAASLTEVDMQRLTELRAEIVLLGTGHALRFPPPSLMRPMALAGIGLEVMDTKAACRTYNILAAEGRKVAAAILLE